MKSPGGRQQTRRARRCLVGPPRARQTSRLADSRVGHRSPNRPGDPRPRRHGYDDGSIQAVPPRRVLRWTVDQRARSGRGRHASPLARVRILASGVPNPVGPVGLQSLSPADPHVSSGAVAARAKRHRPGPHVIRGDHASRLAVHDVRRPADHTLTTSPDDASAAPAAESPKRALTCTNTLCAWADSNCRHPL